MSEEVTGDDLAELVEDADADGISVTLHARTNRVEAATRWADFCELCDEPIASGAVGPAIHEDPRHPNGDGVYSFQHGCGARNLPTSEVVDLDQVADAAAEADRFIEVEPARGSDHDVDEIPAETIALADVTELASDRDDGISDEDDHLVIDPRALADEALAAARRRLQRMVARERRNWMEQERRDLARKLADTRAEYDQLVAEGDEEAAADLLDADDEVRGVGFISADSAELIAWSELVGQIAISESELESA